METTYSRRRTRIKSEPIPAPTAPNTNAVVEGKKGICVGGVVELPGGGVVVVGGTVLVFVPDVDVDVVVEDVVLVLEDDVLVPVVELVLVDVLVGVVGHPTMELSSMASPGISWSANQP